MNVANPSPWRRLVPLTVCVCSLWLGSGSVLGQTSSPGEYTLGGSVFAGDRRIVVRDKTGRLATGESLTTPFDL